MIKYLNYLFLTIFVLKIPQLSSELTASSETLLWRPVIKSIAGISAVEEAFVLVPADYEDKNSPLIPVNILKLTRDNNANVQDHPVNLWFIPGGPGQSSNTLEVIMPVLLQGLPSRSSIYAIDHRGLGKSTPLASVKEKELLESSPKDMSLLPQIIMKHQNKLGILTPITRALRIENVARDLIKAVEMVKKGETGHDRKNFMFGISYGTMIARRALQIAPVQTFEAVLLDGLAPTEKIEQSNESDRILQEFCDKLPECSRLINDIEGDSSYPKVRSIFPSILKNNSSRNTCTIYFMRSYRSSDPSTSLCYNLHEFMNAIWLNGRGAVKIAGLRLMVEMIKCDKFEDFKKLFEAVHESLLFVQPVNQLQSSSSSSTTPIDKSSSQNDKQAAALSSDELVFEIVSTLERYDVTRSSMNICFNRKHSLYGDDPTTCPKRLFDPCKFFKMTWERKQALKGINGKLPSISIKSPLVVVPQTRIIVLAGNLDFNTPTWLSRQITSKYMKAKKVSYHEFFGYGHGIYGSTKCSKDIYDEFLHGTDEHKRRTEECVRSVNERNLQLIDEYFKKSFVDLAEMIASKNYT